MPIIPRFEHVLDDMTVLYVARDTQPDLLGLVLVPTALRARVVTPRENLDAPCVRALPAHWQPMRAGEVDPLVHVHVRTDVAPAGFAHGHTLRNSPTSQALRFIGQTVEAQENRTTIVTLLRDDRGLEVEHRLESAPGDLALGSRTIVRNRGSAPLMIDLVTSFSFGGLPPFTAADEPGRLKVHRLRSAWSAEGRLESRSMEHLHLERSWSGYGVRVERFGQVGSMPVSGFFPFIAVEDEACGVHWAANVACPGSWQMELYRRGDALAVSGGLADREFGHWGKLLQPGETLQAPPAALTVVKGDLAAACDRLLGRQRSALRASRPAVEQDLPVIFNEWCTSWGNPTYENILALADRLEETGIKYLVIDDGWAERPGPGIQQNGDWVLNRQAFPQGLRAVAEALRARGLITGIWFEFEVSNPGAAAWDETAHQLHRDGRPLQVGNRRFWDFRDPWVHDYLATKVIGLLRDNGLGYLKVDYNDTLGLGCDGAESLGEGLRQHLDGVQRFFARLRAELPEVVIENCSSGGHRLEPSFLALTAMSSFSDAHESPDIPVIAANLHRVVLPEQIQIWGVLRPEDSLQRTFYSLAATFLGRMCLSGEVHRLNPEQWAAVRRAFTLYREVAPLIGDGRFRTFGLRGDSYQHPTGWQAVRCDLGPAAFVVWHAFAGAPDRMEIPLEGSDWRISSEFTVRPTGAEIGAAGLTWQPAGDWSGGVIRLCR